MTAMEVLIAIGATVNAISNREGNTLLHSAAETGQVPAIEVLAGYGASVVGDGQLHSYDGHQCD